LNMVEMESGMTMKEIQNEMEVKVETIRWEEKKEILLGSNKGKRELFIERLLELQKATEDNLCGINELQEWAIKELQLSEIQFEELVRIFKHEGTIFEPKAGFLRKIRKIRSGLI